MLVQFKFITKKLLALSLGRVFNYLYPRELPIILNYHGIADRIINGSIFDVEYKEFISQIHYLASLNFRFISLSKLIYLLKNKGLESNYCLITFDDCPHSFLKGAEYLTKLNIPFAAFICYDYAEKNGNWCDWNILREIEEYMPIEYGSHGIFHRRYIINRDPKIDLINKIKNFLNLIYSYLNFRDLIMINTILKSENPDIIHLHYIRNLLLRRYLFSKDNIIYSSHDYSFICPRGGLLRRKGKICGKPHIVCLL